MAKLTIFVPIALFVGLLAACGGGDSANRTSNPTTLGSGTATAATTTVAPSATATQKGTLPGDISQAIDAVKSTDRHRLTSLLTTTQAPCVVSPRPAIFRPPTCPTGTSAGTLVPAIVFGGCPNQFIYVDPSSASRVEGFPSGYLGNHLIGVVDLGRVPLRFAALFSYDHVEWLGFNDSGKLIGAGGGGDCPSNEVRSGLTDESWLVGPDWGD